MKGKKRLLSFLLVMIIVLTMSSVTSMAYTGGEGNDYEDSADTEIRDGMFIVIRDAEGNIVETHEMDRQLYVNGTQYAIPAGGTLTTYQYYASEDFTAGFFFVHTSYSGYATTRDRSIKITVRKASSVGGTRYTVASSTFSTNEEDNTYNPGYLPGFPAYCSAVVIDVVPDSNYRYYDAVYENMSNSSATVSLLVSRD